MKLYFAPRSRAVAVRWLMEELGVPYELERISLAQGQQRSAEFLRINPHGHVPVLVDQGIIVIETVAILAHVTDRHPEQGLAPAFGSAERGKYYQWLFYATASLERHVKQLKMFPTADSSRNELQVCALYVEACLEGRAFIMGDRFSTADIALCHWLKTMRDELGFLTTSPNVLAYLQRLLERPALIRALQE